MAKPKIWAWRPYAMFYTQTVNHILAILTFKKLLSRDVFEDNMVEAKAKDRK